MNQSIPQCPTHGLSLDKDYLCIVCHLTLSHNPPAAYRKCEEGESGMVGRATCGRCKQSKPLSDFYPAMRANTRCRSCTVYLAKKKKRNGITAKAKAKSKPSTTKGPPDLSWIYDDD